ncbi:MAG: hypothetical protein ACI8ZM_004443 [Crocinitomix sp.]|jgi:hypothetical protein
MKKNEIEKNMPLNFYYTKNYKKTASNKHSDINRVAKMPAFNEPLVAVFNFNRPIAKYIDYDKFEG